jgi:hypothetical protein
MNRPTFTYGLELPYHSPADMARKVRVMKGLWFVLPLVLNLGNLWTDPLPTALSILIVWALGLAVYFIVRFVLAKFRPQPLVNRIPREPRPDPRARVPQSLPDQLRTNHPRTLLQ